VKLSGTAREAAAELLGTFVLIAFGSAVVAQVVLGGGGNGTYISINIAWGLAVTMGVYASAGVSGAHLNPAVTVALAVHRGFPWPKVVPYALAQLTGAFLGAAVAFLTYREAFDRFDGGVRQVMGPQATAGIFATYPQPYLSLLGGFVDQVVGTALLMLVILALGDARNFAPEPRLGPVLVGAAVVLIGMSFGLNAGYAINPARDLGPRLFTFVAGWGGDVFRVGNGWWWVPLVAPPIGAVVGGYAYDALITKHHPQEAA
jgi:MIP family channel proteins